ncbi:hypothetical protein [Halodurantibacterium flavum]|uniref:O-antigen polysaccharide polymerase Wzy n=1 Tax=Halodurantibacterium flavum TaxID=1382802 RepID=A0ABW4S894_9RHOB
MSVLWLCWGFLALALWHLGLGSDAYMLVLFLAIAGLGVRAIARPQIWFGDLFVAASALYASGFALILKPLLGQPLQANLHHPQAAATALFAGVAMLALVSDLARRLARGRRAPLAAPLADPAVQGRLAVPVMAAGFAVLALHVALRPRMVDGMVEQGAGFGGLGSLVFLLPLGLALALARASADRRAALAVALGGAGLVLMALTSNTRREFAEFLLMLCALPLILPGRDGRGAVWTALALLMAAGMVLYAAPLIHLMRGSFLTLGWAGRLDLALDLLSQHGFNPARLREAEGAFLRGFTHAWSENGSYVWPSTLPVDRFMLVLPVDQVLRAGTGLTGPGPFLREVAEGVLPSALIAKTAATGADLVAWDHGIRQYGNAARPVIGLAASALAAAGWAGLAVVPLLVAGPVMLAGNLILGPLRGHPLGLFAVALVWVLPEMTLDALAVFGLRILPLVAFTLLLLGLGLRLRPRLAPSGA